MRKTSIFKLLVHTVLTIVTGGLWLVVLIIKFILSNSR